MITFGFEPNKLHQYTLFDPSVESNYSTLDAFSKDLKIQFVNALFLSPLVPIVLGLMWLLSAFLAVTSVLDYIIALKQGTSGASGANHIMKIVVAIVLTIIILVLFIAFWIDTGVFEKISEHAFD